MMANIYLKHSFINSHFAVWLSAIFLLFWFSKGQCQTFSSAFRIGSTSYDEGRSIVVDPSGNMYTTGYFSGTTDFDPGAGTANLTSAGDYEAYVAKYNSSGVYQWAFKLGSTLKDIGFGIVRDASDNIYVCGYFQGTVDFDPGAGTANLTATGGQDIYIAKYSNAGSLIWAKNIGGTANDYALEIAIDSSANICITGGFNGTVDFDPDAGTAILVSAGSDDVFAAKFNSSGAYQWALNIGNTSADVGREIDFDAAGNIYLSGEFQLTADFDPGASTASLTSAGSLDGFLAKYNSSGIYQWAIKLGNTGSDVCYGTSVNGDGTIALTGAFQGTVDFDPGAGVSNLSSLSGSSDIFIALYNSSGVYQNAFNIGSTGIDNGIKTAFNQNGELYATGYFAGTADFDPGAGSALLTSAGSQDIFLAKYTDAGNYLWAIRIGDTGSDVCRNVVVDNSGNIFFTGYFESVVDFDVSGGMTKLFSDGLFDIFIAKYYETFAARPPLSSGFESCDPAFTYDGIQVPVVTTSSPRSGTNHAQINGGCTGGTAGCYDGSVITPLLHFKPGCTYTVQVYAKNVTATGNLTIVKSSTATNASMKAAAGPDIIMASTAVVTSTYTLYQATFTVSTQESKYIGFQMYRAGAGGTSTAKMLIDDISITKDDCSHCANGIQDGNETAVDCGGDCSISAPAGGTISPASNSFVCGSGNFSLALCGQTGSAQWQFSPDGSTWTDLEGETGTGLKGTATNTTFFRAKLVNDGCSPAPAYSNTATVTITGTITNTWQGDVSSDWGTAGNWDNNTVPSNCHNVIIPGTPLGPSMPVITAASQCNNITIETNATLTQNTAAGVFFDIYGDLANSGTFTYSSSATEPRLMGGFNFINSPGTFSGAALAIALQTNSNYFLNSNLTLPGINIVTGGQLSLQAHYMTIVSNFTQNGILNINTGTLEIRENTPTFNSTGLNPGKGTFYLNSATGNSLTINDDFYNVRFGSQGNVASTALKETLTVANNLTIDANHGLQTFFVLPPEISNPITIKGNLINNGVLEHSIAAPSSFTFSGNSAQSIEGSSSTIFNNLIINNSSTSGVTLNNSCTVNGTLTLTTGKLNTSTANMLTMDAGSSVSPAGGSSASFVDGPMQKTGNTAFTFPTGNNSTWARIAITAPALATDVFEAEYRNNEYGTYTIDEAECAANELKEISSTEFWILNRNSGSSTPQLTLYWENTSANNIDNCADLQVAHFDNINNWWENNNFNTVTTSGSCAPNSSGSIQTNTGVGEFGYFTFGSKSSGTPNIFSSGCTPPELYWVGGASGNWNVSANWSTSSGGSGGAGIPGSGTNVYIDNNSGTCVINLPSGTWYTKGFSMSGAGAKTSIIGQGVLMPRP